MPSGKAFINREIKSEPLLLDEDNDSNVRLSWRPYRNLSAAAEAVTTDITFHVVLRRKTLFYLTNIILPIMIISFLSVFMFHLPAESKVPLNL